MCTSISLQTSYEGDVFLNLQIVTGGDNNVQVVLAKYDPPNIKCDAGTTPGPPWESCVSIFTNMRAFDKLHVFGYYEVEGIDVGLPLSLEAGKLNVFSVA